jgi:cell wall-associated NlpC family hydrolase
LGLGGFGLIWTTKGERFVTLSTKRAHAVPHTLVAAIAIGATILSGWVDSAFAAPNKQVLRARRVIENRARRQLGSPYVYGGTSPGGFDCSGFTRWVFLPKAKLPHNSGSQFALARSGRHRRVWKKQNLAPGDLVFFDTTSGLVGHVGIYIGRGRFIHSSSSRGVRIDSVHDPYYYAPRFVGAVRVPALRTTPRRRSRDSSSPAWRG